MTSLILLFACPTPVHVPDVVDTGVPPFEPVEPAGEPWGQIPEGISANHVGTYWGLTEGDCIRLDGAEPFEIRVEQPVDVGGLSGFEVALREFGIPTRIVLGADAEGTLWKLEQEGPSQWSASFPDEAPLKYLPGHPLMTAEFTSGPDDSEFAATSEVRSLADACVVVDRESADGTDEFWTFCRGLGPVQISRDGLLLAAVECSIP